MAFSAWMRSTSASRGNCEVLAAVTRSGRMSRGGAYNAAAKEIVKRLEALGAFK
jgi:hypothetical protein